MFSLIELLPKELISKAVKKSSRALHDETFRKAATSEKKPAQHDKQKLSFSQGQGPSHSS